jgi:hypothetical protein
VQQVSLVQAADGSRSHEEFEIPSWLTTAVRQQAGVGVVRVTHETNRLSGPAGALPAPRPNGNGNSKTNGNGNVAAEAPAVEAPANGGPPALASGVLLRFHLHESDDHDADRRRLDELIALLEQHAGADAVRIFIHASDGDRIELSLPNATVTEELREAGIALLGELGGADAIARPTRKRTAGIETL